MYIFTMYFINYIGLHIYYNAIHIQHDKNGFLLGLLKTKE